MGGAGRSRPAEREAQLCLLASRQRGLVRRDQAEALGVTARMRRARLQSGAWTRVLPGVFRLVAAPVCEEQTLLAACLWGGEDAVVSHSSAAALWGLEGFSLRSGQALVVTTTRDVRTRELQVCRSAFRRARVKRGGLPVTTIERTLLDVCAEAPELAENALNDALRRRLVALPQLVALYQREAGQGTPGLRLFRRLVDRLLVLGKPTQSWLETATAQSLEKQGFRPRRQFEVWVEGQRFRTDFAFPEHKVAVEAQGYRYHHTPVDWAKDQARHSALAAAGWTVLFVTAHELKHRPHVLGDRLRKLLS